MWYRLGVDLVVVLHLAFVIFVVAGGLLVLRWPAMAWLHVTAAAWGAIVEFTGWICPLTPLEQFLRAGAGRPTYETDFIGHYILPLLYPAALTRDIQLILGSIVLGVNVALYGWIWQRKKTKNRP
ncbi:MAG: DUF2784 domain-containing protein [Nitrospirota bacterium]|nr:DUF2784 domain-containing protein [Nitrospirota bacterium]